jgi:hypothetical protein
MNFKININYAFIRNVLFTLGVLLLIIIPKGGFKVSGIPITWGYIYLGLMFILSTLIILGSSKFAINKKHYFSYLATLPFVFYFTLNILFRGYEGTLGNLISFYISFVFLPLLFYIFLSHFLEKLDSQFIVNRISKAILIVSIYGIFLFFYKQIIGNYIEIPYITVNSGDLGQLEDKYNQRGNLFKLISTYNNGNIFGVCLLMLFPMFYQNTKSKLKIGIVILALILTLSRTVWLGLVFFFFVNYRKDLAKLIRIYLSVALIVLLIAFFFITKNFQYGSLGSFILDNKLGGRILQIRQSLMVSFFGIENFETILEIVYLSILKQLGVFGLLFFCLSFFTPVYLFFKTRNNNFVYAFGSIIYLFMCMSDGCMLYIPTLAIFYFVTTLSFISKNKTNDSCV